MAKRKILILGNMSKPGVVEQIDALRGWFQQRAEIVAVQPAHDPAPPGADQADLCVVFGGDGTLLMAARTLGVTGVPLMGLNMGKLGFLAEFDVQHMQKHFDNVLEGRIAPTERIMLQVSVENGPEPTFRSLAANDVSISAGEPFRMIDLNVTRGDALIARYLGDGLVISTPTGSTGYNMSAGGPILEPTLDGITITPIAPHSLSLRPIVIRSDRPVHVTATQVNPGTTVMVDGQVCSQLCDGQIVVISRSEVPMRLIPHPGRSCFDILSEKLHWGKNPYYS
jgi:NAD+ kinase